LRGGVGWEVIPEVDAQSAVAALIENVRIDVIIINYEMPGLDPLSFMTMASKLKPNVPVIVLSRHGNEDIHQEMMSLGAFEHMSEPVTVIELGRVIRSALLNVEQNLFWRERIPRSLLRG
jgi:DNA-binding NtrC family response regulator